jgi:hypothetical protein
VPKLPWEQTQTHIHSGHKNPEDFDPKTVKTVTLNQEEGIKAITGNPKNSQTTQVISYIFSKEKGWTIQKAQEWFEEHQKKGEESFSWTGTIKNIPQTGNLIRGKALHPIRTVHPQEWPQIREYLKEELEKSAHTLAGAPLVLDHQTPINGRVLGAEYEDDAIEYVAQLDDKNIANQIEEGTIKHCSVEFEWQTLEKHNGHAPRGIKFTGLSLLKDYQPGDPKTTVELWEAIINNLKITKEQATAEFILHQINDPSKFMEEHFSTVWIDQTNGVQAVYGLLQENPENPQPLALFFMKQNGWTKQTVNEWLSRHPQYTRVSEQPPIQPARPEAPKPLGEAIIDSSEPLASDLIPKQEVLNMLPEDWIVRAWSLGPQLLVRQIRHRLSSQSTQLTGSKQG